MVSDFLKISVKKVLSPTPSMPFFEKDSYESSVFQVEKKYWNGAKANIRAQKLGLINKDHGSHWTAFKKEVDEKGLRQSATDRFNSYVKSKDICIEDPLPMEDAFELFNELISQ